MEYDDAAWLLACGALSALGLFIAFLVYRKRGWSSGLRVVGWAVLPIAAWLVNLGPLLLDLAVGAARLATGVLTIRMWAGMALFAVAFVVLGGVGFVRRRRAKARGEVPAGGDGGKQKGKPAAAESGKQGGKAPAVGSGKKQEDPIEGMDEIEALLKQRGIE